MKGTLHKTKQGWVVNYHYSWIKSDWETLPLYPLDTKNLIDICDNPIEGRVVEFEMVHFWENGEVGANGLTYAKLIKEEKPFIDNRKDKLETLAKILAKIWFYCDWKWESPNERVMQMLMQDLGLYPFKNEDEMIQQTRVDEDLYKEAVEKVELRNPRLMPVENYDAWDEVIYQLGDTNKMIDHVPDVGKMVEDVEKLAEKYPYGGREGSKRLAFIDGYNTAKETLYTEEQVRDAIRIATTTDPKSEDYIIQSLKQRNI